jgi:hypothetical protein
LFFPKKLYFFHVFLLLEGFLFSDQNNMKPLIFGSKFGFRGPFIMEKISHTMQLDVCL